jgi:hypothetical protein
MPASAEDPARAAFPEAHLAHLDRSDYVWGSHDTEYYTLYPIAVPRPAAGRITTHVICGSCGMAVQCTVCSLAERRRLRRRRTAAGSALLAAVLLLYCCTGLFVSGHREPAIATLNDMAWVFVGFVSLFFVEPVVRLFFPAFPVQDGVFVSRKGGHSVRPPGCTVSTRQLKEPNF